MDADAGCAEKAVGFVVCVGVDVGGLEACPSCCVCAVLGGARAHGGGWICVDLLMCVGSYVV